MYIHSGMIKANKKDIEAIKTFIRHAEADMSFGEGGSYVKRNGSDEVDKRELKKGYEGLLLVEFILRGLCDKWN